MTPRAQQRASAVLPFVLWVGLALTVVNALKPLHIDDPFILRVAEQIAASPLDPYGFDIFWLQWPQPVHEELTPPVLPYWWALSLALSAGHPVLWKLWLLPFALLLVGALHSLLRRFAPGSERWGTVLIVLSPAILPGFNLMQDVPAIALGLGALVLWLRAFDRGSVLGALGAGLVAGLATQTKYTMVGVLAALVLHALLHRQIRLVIPAIVAAIGLFAAWEAAMTAAYGQGMFLGQVRYGLFWLPRTEMILPLLRIVGAVAPIAAVVGLAGLGLSPRWVPWCLGGILAGFASLWFAPAAPVLFSILGLAWFAVLTAVSVRLLQGRAGGSGSSAPHPGERAMDRFLILWLLVEVGVYFATSPFPAVRRVLGVVLVASLIILRQYVREGAPGLPARSLAACGVLLALLFQWTDVSEARAQRTAVALASESILQSDPDASIWFVGHWGFQYYAESAGMRPIVPDVSRLEAGDWVVDPSPVDKQQVRFDAGTVSRVRTLAGDARPPLTTGYGYYGGALPLSHLDGPRLVTEIYRVETPVIPESAWSAALLADWAVRAGGQTAAAAAPALSRTLVRDDGDGRFRSARALAELGSRAEPATDSLVRALTDPHPGVRYWSAVALGAIGPPARRALPGLRAAEADPDADVRSAAGSAIGRITGDDHEE